MLPVAPGPVALRKTLGIMLSYRWRLVGVLTLQVVAVLSTLVAPQLLGRLVTRVSGGTATWTGWWGPLWWSRWRARSSTATPRCGRASWASRSSPTCASA